MSLVGKPSQMTVFDALYSIAAGDGRGEALFGNSFGLARDAYERTLIGDGYPAAYIEFPLLGSPGFDLLSVHNTMQAVFKRVEVGDAHGVRHDGA